MTDTAAPASPAWLEHFPVPMFAVTMGLAGSTLALRGAETALGLAEGMSRGAFWVTLAVFAAIAAVYLAKAAIHPRAVLAEWHHPVRMAFFPAISISLMLLGTAALTAAPGLAAVLWMPGAALQFVLTLAVVSNWISARAFQAGVLNPGWFIPAVGNVIVPLAGAPLGYVELSWYFMAVGLVFWIVLLTLVINRLMFHDPMPARLQPSLVILIAPPAVAFTAWVGMHGGVVDDVARILINSAYFFTALVFLNLPRLLRLPFAVSFWALGFPFAAVTVASLRFAEVTGSVVHQGMGLALLAVLAVIIAGLTWRTLRAILRHELFVPE